MGLVSPPDIDPAGVLADDRIVPFPQHTSLSGQYVSLVPMSPAYSASLFANLGGPKNAHLFTYLPRGHLIDQADCDELVSTWTASKDYQHFAVISPDGEALGAMSYLNIVPQHRRIEIGWVILGDALKRTRMATETFYLLMKRAFDELGYQRVEWKANAKNAASLSAAERLGFTFEGIFRKHVVVKGRFRDTAWFSITDDEWPAVRHGLETWLNEDNFDSQGRQKRGLKECRESA